MGADDLKYPALGKFPDGSLKVIPTSAYLTLNTAVGLREGYFTDLEIVDSRGKWIIVRAARKLHGEGRFGGYNLFLNQRIRVELDLHDEDRNSDVEQIRALILGDFESWLGWRSREDYTSLREAIISAPTITDLLGRLAAAVT